MRYNARSKLSQKLISCKAVPEAGSRSSLVTFKGKTAFKSSHYLSKGRKIVINSTHELQLNFYISSRFLSLQIISGLI